MKSLHTAVTALGVFFLSLSAAQAQAPVLDGVIGATEYGSSYISGGQIWYMTWNDTNLYVATRSAAVREATVMYFDTNPLPIVNGGGTVNGTLTGFNNYDGTSGNLPFRADAVVFIRPSGPNGLADNYREVRTVDSETGLWSPNPITTGIGDVAFGPGDVREFSIPWSVISTTGARPANFNWFGYITSPTGFVFAQVPREGPSGFVGNNASFVRYFTTLNTAATGSANNAFGPNGLDSYTHIGDPIDGFGAINIYDFTLNTSGAFIIRGNGNVPWNISGNLRVENGSLDLSGSASSVSVAGDLTFANSGAFTSSTNLFLTGNGNQTISGDTYSSLTIQGTGTKTLIGGNLSISNSLTINNGTLVTGTNTVVLGTTGQLNESANGYLLGRVSSLTPTPLSSEGASYNFGNIGLTLTQGRTQGSNILNNVSVVRVTGFPGTLQGGNPDNLRRTISRRFSINADLGNTPGNQAYNVSMAFGYRSANPNELGGNEPSSLELYQSESASNFNGTYNEVNPLTYNRTTPNLLGVTGSLRLDGSFFSLADGITPLPVELASFTGKAENNAVRLNWVTASELNNKGFEVEHSVDAASWRTLGFVAGNGTTSQRNNYNYLDRTAAAGTNYYRLRQIDLDGKSVYSQPVTVATGAGEFTLSPVPATDVLTFNGLGAGQHTAEIYNSRGQRVLSKEFKADAATTVAVNSLPAGVYMVRVVGADRSSRNARFIKN